ncbi:MAG: PEP-CTERM sorting domain-containing protein [Planctomycetota bacterium]|nr:MAG: PEP-CTERM sorting domain-containing protein [Planctomycetota bacterium]
MDYEMDVFKKKQIVILIAIVAIFLLLTPAPCFAIVVHIDQTPADKPHDNVLGRWGTNASCVMISGNEVLTTRHQGGGVGTTVQIGGVDYLVDEVTNIGLADLRIAVLTTTEGDPISLTNYVSLYSTTNETNKTGILAGFGMGRGATLYTGGDPYGYEWSGSDNTTQRWGANKVNGTSTVEDTYTSDVIYGDFDGIDEGDYVTYEAAPATWDSGGGWFIDIANEWYVAGIIRAVEHSGETWYRNSADPDILDPDTFDAVRISSYYDDIVAAMQPVPEPATVCLLGLGALFFRKNRLRPPA